MLYHVAERRMKKHSQHTQSTHTHTHTELHVVKQNHSQPTIHNTRGSNAAAAAGVYCGVGNAGDFSCVGLCSLPPPSLPPFASPFRSQQKDAVSGLRVKALQRKRKKERKKKKKIQNKIQTLIKKRNKKKIKVTHNFENVNSKKK
ncbi:hypothetical protein CAOG_009939 [Capsaspora owczarzaki ATCC 30864]|uniref:Uncharacterized protein n=1 Tax=Capsaspora owczarzaki (strain ATCC 30864) TaxID=595528 RepID=A0A0D2WUH3_CAPO3|nr:hypothetical protein CAOG_009939 [Capsaspora owczarzaki ATCC 30864]